MTQAVRTLRTVVKPGRHGGAGNCIACALPDPESQQLTDELVRRVPLNRLEKKWGIARASLRAHRENHLSPAIAALRTERASSGVRKVADRVEDLITENDTVRGAARKRGNAVVFLKAHAMQRANYELLARVTGELDERPQVTVNLMQSAEFLQVQAVILEVLDPYPLVKERLAQKLAALEGVAHPVTEPNRAELKAVREEEAAAYARERERFDLAD